MNSSVSFRVHENGSECGPISRRDSRTVPNCSPPRKPYVSRVVWMRAVAWQAGIANRNTRKHCILTGSNPWRGTRDSIRKPWSAVYSRRWQPREQGCHWRAAGREWFGIKQKPMHEDEDKERKRKERTRNTHERVFFYFILACFFQGDKQAVRSWQIRGIRTSCRQPRVFFVWMVCRRTKAEIGLVYSVYT